MSVPAWTWAAFAAFVAAVLALDLFVLHRRAGEVSVKEAGAWSAVWVVTGLGFAGLLWAWQGGGAAGGYLAGYLIEKSLSVDNVFVFAVIFQSLAIPSRYQHRVLMFGIIGALLMRGAFIVAGIALLEAFHPVIYIFGAVLFYAAVKMLRAGSHPRPQRGRVMGALRRVLPVTEQLHGQRFVVRGGRWVLATPLLLALIVIEVTDVIFAIDSIPAILAVTTDPFLVFTSNVFALLGMRALYFLLAGAAARFRYLRPGLAIILAAVAAKLLLTDLYHVPAWASPAFIVAVLATAGALSVWDSRRAPRKTAAPLSSCDGRRRAARETAAPLPSRADQPGVTGSGLPAPVGHSCGAHTASHAPAPPRQAHGHLKHGQQPVVVRVPIRPSGLRRFPSSPRPRQAPHARGVRRSAWDHGRRQCPSPQSARDV